MVKIRRNFIKLCWLILLFQIGNSSQVFAEEITQSVRDMELLFVIDNSGSVRKEAESIMETIDLLQDWLETEPLISSVDYIAMAEESQYAEYEAFSMTGKYTCIKSGIEMADEWLKERHGDGKVKGIVFVTDLVESHKAVVGESFDKSTEQQGISVILNRWENDYSDEMDYLFITWKTDESTLDSDWEFICKISESKLCNLKKGGENGSEESISKINMTGIIMQNIVEILVGVELEGNYKTSALKQINLKKSSILYGFIILDKGALPTVTEEQGDLRRLDVQLQTDSMQIYRLTEQDAGKIYQLQSDNETVSYFLCYIPKEDLLFTINHGFVVQAGEKFDISFRFKTNDYRRRMVESPLYICFIDPDTGEKTEIRMEETSGEFIGSGVLQRAGTYDYEVRNEGNEVLESSKIKVIESESATLASHDDDTLQPDEEPFNIKYIITVVILVLLAGGVAVLIVNRMQKGAR